MLASCSLAEAEQLLGGFTIVQVVDTIHHFICIQAHVAQAGEQALDSSCPQYIRKGQCCMKATRAGACK